MSQPEDNPVSVPASHSSELEEAREGSGFLLAPLRDRKQVNEVLAAALLQLAEDPSAIHGIRALLLSMERIPLRQGAEALERILEIDPSDAVMWKILSSVSRHLGELENSLRAARRAVELSSDDPECWYVLGRASEGAGDVTTAADAYEAALRLRPGYGKALDRLHALSIEVAETDAEADRALVSWEVDSLNTEPPPHEDRLIEAARRLRKSVNKKTLTKALAEIAQNAGNGTRQQLICDCLNVALGEPCPPWITSGEFESTWEWVVPAIERLDHFLAMNGSGADLLAALKGAHRYAPIGDISFVRRLDRSRQRPEDTVCLVAAKLLALRQPIVSNLSSAADIARRFNDEEFLEWTCARFLRVYGESVAHWPLTLDYLEFSSAGAICVYLARRAGLQRDTRAALKWSLSGIDLLEQAIRIHPEGNDWHSSIRLATICGETLWHSARELGDVEVARVYELGRMTAVRLAEGGKVYEAARDLARMNAGLAKRLLAKGKPQAEIDRHIELANSSFQKYEQLVRGGEALSASAKRNKIAGRLQAFLVEMLPSPAAQRALAALPRKSILTDARVRFHQGKRREAIRFLLTSLETDKHSPHRGVDFVAIGILIAEFFATASTEGLRERFRATVRQRQLAGLFVEAAREAKAAARSAMTLDEELSQYERARRCLEIAEIASPGSVQILHLRVNIEETAGAASTEVIPLLLAALRSEMHSFLSNSYLLDQLLKHLGQITPDLTEREESAIERAGVASSDRIIVQRTLLWLLGRINSTTWIEHYLRARRQFPQDSIFPRLLVQSFARCGNDKGSEIVTFLLIKAASDPVSLADIERIAPVLPLEFYRRLGDLVQELQPEAFQAATGSFWRAIARGISEVVLNAPSELAPQTLMSLTALVPGAFRILWWTEILGSGRRAIVIKTLAQCERLLAEQRNTLLREPNARRWTGLMEEFLPRHTAMPDESGVEDALLDEVINFCLAAASRYRPDDLDPNYWKRLEKLVREAYEVTATDRREHLFATAWGKLMRRLVAQTQQQLLTSMKAPLHQLKNSWDHELRADSLRRRSLPGAWHTMTNAVFDRALHYVRAHRWPRVEEVDLRTVIERAVYEPPSPFVAVHSIRHLPRLWTFTPKNEPILAMVDAELLGEVLWELLANARDAVRHAGRHGWVLARLLHTESRATLIVEDSGAEEPPSEAVFTRLNNPSSGPVPSQGRPGFGVAFCHRVVAAHGGTLVYQRSSCNATGLRIELTLPSIDPVRTT